MSTTALPLVAEPAAGPDLIAFEAVLRQTISGEVRFDRLSRALYSTDASVYQIVPAGVALPRTEEDVVAAVTACARFGVPLTVRGGGTSQAGQAIGPGLVLDCSKYFNQVLEINAAERWARVRPGCVLDDLNRELKPHGLQFAPDISTADRATVGGMIANNSSGTHSLIHGKTADHVRELRVVLADGSVATFGPVDDQELQDRCRQKDLPGACYRAVRRLATDLADEIDRRYPKILRRVGGYNLDLFTPARLSADAEGFNLAHLLVGSEGTLAVTLEAKLRLVELPRAKALLVVQFADLLQALAATPAILTHGPAAVEAIDRYVLNSTRLNLEASRLREFLQGDPGAILIVEFYADRSEALPARLEDLENDLRGRGVGDHFHRATELDAQGRIWKLRRLALGLSMAEKGDAKAISFVEDSAVAPERLRDYIAEVLQVIARHGTTAGVYAHASVGCLHVRPVVNLKTAEGVARFEAIAGEVAELVLKYGGALSGEHGDGLVRSQFQEKMFGPALYQAFREIKRTFDPDNILNPGKIVDAPPMTASLRYGAGYVTPEIATTFDFSADGGFVRAAELCVGVGECRKRESGTMCPSFQATREEQHSTRGRANALRLACTGQLGLDGMAEPAVREVLDLCLECKACKSECPTNVDMARLKAEFLHQYFRVHGLPLRNRLFGNLALLGRWGSRLAPLANRLTRARWARWFAERLLGIDRRRTLPPFARRTLRQQWVADGPADGRPEVLLFPDTFVNYFEPELGLAAADVLRRLGRRVVLDIPGLPGKLACCGRSLISSGQLAEAVRLAEHNVRRLSSWADSGKPIVGCEPSCILTIKDDYPALLRGDSRTRAEKVAAACLSFEESAESLASNMPPVASGPSAIFVQGHCHQRSLVGMGPAMRLLRRIPGARVVDLDAGCCGMAGAFGYEAEHYEVSRLVGEARLFPALRQAPQEAVFVAPGFSCRKQIADFTGRRAVHPAELLYSLLK